MSQENVARLRTALDAYNRDGPEAIISFHAPTLSGSQGNQIVVLGDMHARGRVTGVEAQIPLAIVFTAGKDGKLVRYESFRDREEALEAVGLSEQDARADS